MGWEVEWEVANKLTMKTLFEVSVSSRSTNYSASVCMCVCVCARACACMCVWDCDYVEPYQMSAYAYIKYMLHTMMQCVL